MRPALSWDIVHLYPGGPKVGPFSGELWPGRWLAIVGPSGAGKTTLISILAGRLFPSNGTVWLDGVKLSELGEAARARRLAVVSQVPPPPFALTVREVVALGRLPWLDPWERWGFRWSARHEKLVDRALAATGLSHLDGRSYQSLSGGERQRVMLAKALAQEARLLLLDEPTAHLDVGNAIKFLDYVQNLLGSGYAVISATHDLLMATSFAQEAVLLKQGQVLVAGSVDEVLTAANLESAYGIPFSSVTHPMTGRPLPIPNPLSPPGILEPPKRKGQV